MNDFVQTDEPPIEILYIDEKAADIQLGKLERLRGRGTTIGCSARWTCCSRRRARRSRRTNLMPPVLDAVRAYATVGEMCDALRQVWGE